MPASDKQKLFNRYAFLVMAFLLMVFESVHIIIGYWTGDFWQHSAVVNELSKDLLYPRNAFINADIPHAFYSPYSLLVAKFAELTNLGPVNALSFFAFFNLTFFLWSLYYFCRSIFKEQAPAITAISLFLMLFLVGNALPWSGFFHFYFIHKGLPYPSTFAFALSLFILGKMIRLSDNNSRSTSIIIIVLSGIVFITHPNTGIFVFVAMIALYFTTFNFQKAFIRSMIIIVPALLLSLLWPYYNMLDLLFGENQDFNTDSEILYQQIHETFWPVVLALPAIALIRYDRIIRFFITAIVSMILIYAVGYFFRIYGLGRIISPIIIFSNFLIAYALFVFWNQRKNIFRLYLGLVLFAVVISLTLNLNLLKRTLSFSERNTSYYSKFKVLKSLVKEDETILSDLRTSLFIPTFNGKVIAISYPLYWINDIDERRRNIETFFTNGTDDSARLKILKKYQLHYILIDYTSIKPTEDDIKFFRNLGKAVYKKEDLELIRLNNQ